MAAPVLIQTDADLRPYQRTVEREIPRILKKFQTVSVGGNLGGSFDKATSSVGKFEKSLESAFNRFTAFGTVATIIFGVERALSQLVKTTVGVEKSLTDINVILRASEQNLARFGNQLFTVAKQTGQTFDVASKAAVEFSRQGLGLEETLKRTRDALILTRLSGLDVVASTEALTAAINSFRNAAIDSTAVVNKLATVDAKFAVSSADLAEAISRVGSTAEDTGVSIDSLIALVTSAQQITARGGSVIGNSFKTIFQRIQRPDTLNQLEELGIVVRDVSGEALAADKILLNLAKSYDTLSSAQKNTVVQLSAGVFQANVFRAILSDLANENSFYAQALDTSNKATDEAIKRNQELNKTLSALLNESLGNLTEFGANLGNLTVTPILKDLLGSINSVLTAGNGVLGQSAEGIGAEFAKGFVTGITKYLSTGGVIIFTVFIAKIIKDIAKFSKLAISSLANVNKYIVDKNGLQNAVNNAATQELTTRQKITRELEIQNGFQARMNSFSRNPAAPIGRRLIADDVPARIRFISDEKITQINRLLDKYTNAIRAGGSASAFPGIFAQQVNKIIPAGQPRADEIRRIINTVGKDAFREAAGAFRIETSRFQTQARLANTLRQQEELVQRGGTIFGFGARRQIRQTNPKLAKQLSDEVNSKLTNRAFIAGILAPIVASTVAQTSSSRRTGMVANAVGETVATAATGFAITGGGPQGLITGGILGLFQTIRSIITITKEWNNNLEELQSNLQKSRERTNLIDENFSKIIALRTQLQSSGGISPEKIIDITDGLSQAVVEIQRIKPEALKGIDILKADINKILEIRNAISKDVRTQESIDELALFIKNLKEQKKQLSITLGGTDTGALSTNGRGFVKQIRDSLVGMGISGAIRENPEILKQGTTSRYKNVNNEILGAQSLSRTIGGLLKNEDIGKQFEDLILGLDATSDTKNSIISAIFTELVKFDSYEVRQIGKKVLSENENKLKIAADLQRLVLERIIELSSNTLPTALGRAEGFRTGQTRLGISRRNAAFDVGAESLTTRQRIAEESRISRLNTQEEIAAQRANLFSGFARGASGFGGNELQKAFDQLFSPENTTGIEESVVNFVEGLRGKIDTFSVQAFSGNLGRNEVESFQNELLGNIRSLSEAFLRREVPERDRKTAEGLIDSLQQLSELTKNTLGQDRELSDEEQAKLDEIIINQQKQIDIFERGSIAALRSRLGTELSGREFSDLSFQRRRLEGRETLSQGGTPNLQRDAFEAFRNEFVYNRIDFYEDIQSGARETASTIKSSFNDAFRSFRQGSMDAGDAFRSFAIGVLDKVSDITQQISTNLLFNAIGSAFPGTSGLFTNSLKGYARGGLVTSGSGSKDDVPALLMKDEYVISKKAVEKYGKGFFDKINNSQSASATLQNEFLYNDAKYPTGGSRAIDSRLSSFALEDENNPQNAIRNEREQTLADYIRAKQEYDKQKAAALKGFKNAQTQRLIGAYINAAIGFGTYGLGQIGNSSGYNASTSAFTNVGVSYNQQPVGLRSTGFAKGGAVITGSGTRDDVPAMLMKGEYVINKGAVGAMGRGFFDKINSGITPKGMANGGMVGDSLLGISTPDGGNVMEELRGLIGSINTLTQTLSTKNQGNSAPSITIQNNIQIDKEGNANVATSQNGSNQESPFANPEFLGQLNDAITNVTLNVINEQTKPNGLIRQRLSAANR